MAKSLFPRRLKNVVHTSKKNDPSPLFYYELIDRDADYNHKYKGKTRAISTNILRDLHIGPYFSYIDDDLHSGNRYEGYQNAGYNTLLSIRLFPKIRCCIPSLSSSLSRKLAENVEVKFGHGRAHLPKSDLDYPANDNIIAKKQHSVPCPSQHRLKQYVHYDLELSKMSDRLKNRWPSESEYKDAICHHRLLPVTMKII